jgi:DNA-binding response OmpR family regulator
MQILLVEDDLRLGEQLKPEIERAGYEVTWARSARSALATFDVMKPDVVLLDLMLPDGSGYVVLETIRLEHTTPVIVISARSLGEDKVRALDLGADDYVTKPFWTNELTARIRAVLRRHGTHVKPTQTTCFGNVTIDMVARQAYVSEQLISLTPTEFELLDFFVQRPRQALRRERIIDSVFRNPGSATEALQTHISRLRKKLGPDGARIETVWGIGYRFNTAEDFPI